jgi:uncharacterized protein YdhG (YjbR/CyaY superfamily)
MTDANARAVDEYIAAQPTAVRGALRRLREVIKSAAPEARESLSYKMPAYHFHGRLVYFGAFRRHIGFYPRASGIAAFKKELARYEGARGSIKFPLDEPLPFGLIRKIVRFRVRENSDTAKQ